MMNGGVMLCVVNMVETYVLDIMDLQKFFMLNVRPLVYNLN